MPDSVDLRMLPRSKRENMMRIVLRRVEQRGFGASGLGGLAAGWNVTSVGRGSLTSFVSVMGGGWGVLS